MSPEQPSRDVDRILAYLEEREDRAAEWRARIDAQLASLSKQVRDLDIRVGLMHQHLGSVTEDLKNLEEVVIGTAQQPGLATRVDRIEQAILLLRWFFGGGLVAAAAAIVVLWRFAAAVAHHP